MHHTIEPLPENMVWGYLDAAVPPVLRVASGDTVALTSWAASNEARLPPDRSLVRPDHLRALRECAPGPATHLVTGPVFVEGARWKAIAADADVPIARGESVVITAAKGLTLFVARKAPLVEQQPRPAPEPPPAPTRERFPPPISG